MAGIMLPSLQGQIGTKAHKSSAKNPHPQENFAEFIKAQAHKTKEARKNNQPARTAPAEGQKQEPSGDAPRKRSAVEAPLALVAPFGMIHQTPTQVLGGRAFDVAAASKVNAHPKTSKGESSQPLIGNADKQKAHTNTVVNKQPETVNAPQGERSISNAVSAKAQAEQRQEQKNASQASSPQTSITSQVASQSSAVRPALVIQQSSAPQSGVVSQVANLIIQTSSQGGSKAEMILHPESLGSVQVQLSVDSNGVLQGIITADPQALLSLTSEIDHLRTALESAGIQLGDMQMQSYNDQSSNRAPSGQGQKADISIGSSTSDGAVETIQTLPVSSLIRGGAQLDLII